MSQYVNIHTHKPKGVDIELISAPIEGRWPNGNLFSFGLHPWDVEKVDKVNILEELELICIQKNVISIGEVGIDRAIDTPLMIQTEYFIKQLEVSEKYDLPVIVHNVKATSDLLQIRKKRINSICVNSILSKDASINMCHYLLCNYFMTILF